jgi:hypothetical protein
MGCPLPPNVFEMSTTSSQPMSNTHQTVVNSIPVTRGTTRWGSTIAEVIRALGTEVGVRGPLGAQVIATLTYSALSVVHNSSVNSIPLGWHDVTFGGIRFAVPGQWTFQQESSWGGCPYNIEPNVLVLSTARYFSAPSCPAPPGTAGDLAASPGMVLGSGPEVGSPPPEANCLTRNGLRICIDPPPPPDGSYSPAMSSTFLPLR